MKLFKTKIDQILESKTDEREILENSILFKSALEKIVFIVDWVWFLSVVIGALILFTLTPHDIMCGKIYFGIITGEAIICFIIDLITFIYIRKTLDKNTFGGNINKKTFAYSTHFLIYLFFIVIGILVFLGIKINDRLYFIIYLMYPVINILINIYFTHKYKK